MIRALGLVVILLAAPLSRADQGVEIGYGEGARSLALDFYRVAWQWEWERRWFESRVGSLSGYWELHVAAWDSGADDSGGIRDDGDETIIVAGGTPVFRYSFSPWGGMTPFVEAAVGLVILSDQDFRSGKPRSRPLGSHWQFEDRVGAGVRFGRRQNVELMYRLYHYSNLNFASENHGIDAHLVSLRWWYGQD